MNIKEFFLISLVVSESKYAENILVYLLVRTCKNNNNKQNYFQEKHIKNQLDLNESVYSGGGEASNEGEEGDMGAGCSLGYQAASSPQKSPLMQSTREHTYVQKLRNGL